jgi:membrane protein DedA with SNARE-associated domain
VVAFGAELVSSLPIGVAKLQPVLNEYGLGALFVAALVEGFGIPLPGQTLLIACGLMAATGRMDITSVLVVGWVATQLGDVIGYLIGQRGSMVCSPAR